MLTGGVHLGGQGGLGRGTGTSSRGGSTEACSTDCISGTSEVLYPFQPCMLDPCLVAQGWKLLPKVDPGQGMGVWPSAGGRLVSREDKLATGSRIPHLPPRQS